MPADTKRKEARKRKFGAQTTESLPGGGVNIEVEHNTAEEPPRKKAKQAESSQEASEITTAAAKNEAEAPQKAQRFIVFIGNLPYTATDASIQKHFAKVHAKSIRHRTDKDTGKSKGFAFLEFEGYDRMKTCLKLYHQSSFDDGESPARKLNVELTAGGGGGKSRERKTKLRVKNERLNEQRKRKMQEEEKLNKEGKKKKDKEPESTLPPADNSDIHPSRRSRVAGGSNDT
ncbi:hypothetical protein OEA41_006099 [Lepraria neglecta]|uniref:RRM domain-containing protein n=1 Tax=Lepraria neglecta TaxID=209136 RepID=A0AAD9Z791_9LECA|nr:hypothetical protein OEA41_006099 [Lepraria neglecta]